MILAASMGKNTLGWDVVGASHWLNGAHRNRLISEDPFLNLDFAARSSKSLQQRKSREFSTAKGYLITFLACRIDFRFFPTRCA